MIIFLQIFLVWETGSEVIFYFSQVERWNSTYTFIYQLLSPSHHTFYRFTKIKTNLRCLELYYWKCLWITRLLLVINNFSNIFPTFRVGYYADKPTESAVYCVYKINLKQNILCFNFLWVTDVISDRFLDQSRSFRKPDNITVWEMLKQKLFDERMSSGFKQKQ